MHDCEALGCAVSWDGYILDADRFNADHPNVRNDQGEKGQFMAGDAVPGRTNPGDEWEVSEDGTAQLRG